LRFGSAALFDFALRLTLAIPVAYHGAWNLGANGAQWWAESSGLPVPLRFLVGGAELAASLSLVTGVLSRLAAVGLAIIFAGAIPQHWGQGYSFKHGGWEPVLVYAMLALLIALRPKPQQQPAR
jgi:putative oxidoreductase